MISLDYVLKIVNILVLTFNFLIVGVFFTIWFHRNRKKENVVTKTMICLTDLFPYYKDVMKEINEALTAAKSLEKYLEDCEDRKDFSHFNEEYYSVKYFSLLDVHYFFELLGTLLRQKEINKNTVHHYFSFPIEFFIKTENMRKLIHANNCLPSYAENFCWIFLFYN
jgi:hypothetical protein